MHSPALLASNLLKDTQLWPYRFKDSDYDGCVWHDFFYLMKCKKIVTEWIYSTWILLMHSPMHKCDIQLHLRTVLLYLLFSTVVYIMV